MLTGKTVIVHRKETYYDDQHDRVTETVDEVVDNVLIAPGKTSDVTAYTHFEGVQVDFTLGFPKTYPFKSLKGCSISLPAPWNLTGKVIGNPVPNDIDNCPTDWYWTVQIEAQDG